MDFIAIATHNSTKELVSFPDLGPSFTDALDIRAIIDCMVPVIRGQTNSNSKTTVIGAFITIARLV